MSFVLKIEKSEPGSEVEHYRFEGHGKRIFRLGRLRSCHVPLDGARIPKLQAVIVMEGSCGRLANISKSTPLRINGETLRPGRIMELGAQSRLEVGHTHLDVRIRPGGGESTLARLQALVQREASADAQSVVPPCAPPDQVPVATPTDALRCAQQVGAPDAPNGLSVHRRLSLGEVFDDLQLPERFLEQVTEDPSDETRRLLVQLRREETRRRTWLVLAIGGLAALLALALAGDAPSPGAAAPAGESASLQGAGQVPAR